MVIQPLLMGQVAPRVSKDSLSTFQGPVVPLGLGSNLDNSFSPSPATAMEDPAAHALSPAVCSFLPRALPARWAGRDGKEMPCSPQQQEAMQLALGAGAGFEGSELPPPGSVEPSVPQKIWDH